MAPAAAVAGTAGATAGGITAASGIGAGASVNVFTGAATAGATQGLAGSLAAMPASFSASQFLSLAIGGIQAASALQSGNISEANAQEAADIARQRAELDEANAKAIRRTSVERALILQEQRDRLLASQTSAFISGGIRTNVGVPLLVEAETRADIAKDTGFILETGRVQSAQLRSSAGFRGAKAKRIESIGKSRKRKSRLDAIGIATGASLSFLGVAA